MATKKTTLPREKAPAKPAVSVEEQLADALAEKLHQVAVTHIEAKAQTVCERVSIGTSETVFSITRVSDKDVDLHLPDTNNERFRVPVNDLRYVEAPKKASRQQPGKPAISLE